MSETDIPTGRICCLCGEPIYKEILREADPSTNRGPAYWSGGHNPAPIPHYTGDRCCLTCQNQKVMPVRFGADLDFASLTLKAREMLTNEIFQKLLSGEEELDD